MKGILHLTETMSGKGILIYMDQIVAIRYSDHGDGTVIDCTNQRMYFVKESLTTLIQMLTKSN